MALPEFGLMTKADKQKLDGIATSSLLTKTEAASTYATKAEMREYIKQVLESDTGFVFMNGNNSEVGVIPVLGDKKDPQLSVNPTSLTDFGSVTVSRLGTGTITATTDACFVTVDGNTVSWTYNADNREAMPSSYNVSGKIVINVAATDEYAAASIEVPVSAYRAGASVD